ncbi:MAG: hypothetical protein WCG80_06760 [Spirochaetales bacterium]
MSDVTYEALLDFSSPRSGSRREPQQSEVHPVLQYFNEFKKKLTNIENPLDLSVEPRDVQKNSTLAPVQLNTEQKLSRFVIPATGRVVLSTFKCLGRWECRVVEISEDSFVAVARDLMEVRPEYTTEIPRAEIAADDQNLFEVGAVFYWSIGMRTQLDGQTFRVSEIRFRRMSRWTKSDFRKAKKAEATLFTSLEWD